MLEQVCLWGLRRTSPEPLSLQGTLSMHQGPQDLAGMLVPSLSKWSLYAPLSPRSFLQCLLLVAETPW